MATTDIRYGVRQIAFKVESTPGTDSIAGTPAGGDYVTCMADIGFQYDQFANPVETGTYDDLPPIAGAQRATVSIRLQLVGSGTAGTAPDWGKLLPGAAMIATTTAAAVGAPTAATAGTATTATAQAPFGTTAQQYRGMPVLLTGNPAAGATDIIVDYTAGRVATLANTYSPVLSTSTLLQIPVNILYSPTSDDSQESWFTIYAWSDELQHIITGAKPTAMAINLTNGAPAELSMTFTGQVKSKFQNVARPTGYTPNTRQPPLWRAGMSRLNRTQARVRSVTFDLGIRGSYLENPEASQAYDPAIITGRAPRIRLDPFSHSTDTPLRAGAMDAQTSVPYAAWWGTSAGNRFAVSCPSGVIVDMQPGTRSELVAESITIAPDQPNASIFLALW